MNAFSRSDFTLRDPSALGALLVYDWRSRGLLTDEEIVDAVDRPVTTGVLRHLQRLDLVRSIHGVRAQGGRMRLWPLSEALRVQVVLDLRQATGVRLSNCVDALRMNTDMLNAITEDWESHVGGEGDPRLSALLESDVYDLLTTPAALERSIRASVRAFVHRNAFDSIVQPSFLL